MKNVAKCDTWCELQNPVNHRVFERKLRPKPLGRGHACLGVTHPSPPHTSLPLGREAERGRTLASRGRPSPRLAENRSRGDVRHDERWISHGSASRASRRLRDPPRERPETLDRDPRSGGTTR